MSKKKVRATKQAKNNVNNDINPLDSNNPMRLEFSFEGLYYSVNERHFNNYLKNEKDFVEHFRQLRNLVEDLKGKKFNDLMQDPNNHCHKLGDPEIRELACKCIYKSLKACNPSVNPNVVEQLIQDEDLYQLGYNKSTRIIGTYDNISEFRIYLIDFNHTLYFNEGKNKNSKKTLKYCPMKGKK